MNLLEDLKNLPHSSGVYQYFNDKDKLLYIGKAKNLHNRVKSYFKFTPILSPSSNLSPRIYKMISETVKIRYILVENEHDALILENSLIKQLRPKYNILLRDDKTYPYIVINLNESFPRFEITRKIVKDRGVKYFGPFTNASREIIDSIYLLFDLVQKKNCLSSKKACLFHQMKRCHAPCVGNISTKEYRKIVNLAIKALKDRKIMLQMLEAKMQNASKALNFEEAALIRNKITAIKNSLHVSAIDFAKLENLDIFCIIAQERRAIIMKMFMRSGKIVSANHDIVKSPQGFDIDELYKRAILQFYSNNSPLLCKQILVADDFSSTKEIEKFLQKNFNKKIKITSPKIGDKANLIKISKKNALHLLSLESNKEEIYDSLQTLFELSKVPYRIEVFDNSHLGGVATVGAMVVWEKRWKKSEYKRYNLHSKDEYSQMKELLSRRIKSFDTNPKPDLWILDGGSTLLKLANTLLEEENIELDVLAISKEKLDEKSVRSKGRARDIIHSNLQGFHLDTNDKRLLFLQRMRDEAHRFAISFHKSKKVKIDLSDNLTKIDGIGNATIKKLLAYFGTFDAIYNASLEDLSIVLNKNLAKKIYKLNLKGHL